MSELHKDIYYFPYVLKPQVSLNRWVDPSYGRQGALLKISFVEGLGYADLFPWVELGDEPLEIQIEKMRKGDVMSTPILKQTYLLAKRDASARASGRNLLAGAESLYQNFLILDSSHEIYMDQIKREGFPSVKLKFRGDYESLYAILLNATAANLKVRLDCNGGANFQELYHFFKSLSEEFLKTIEYVEEPVPYNFDQWTLLSQFVPLALDESWDQFFLKKK